ncbi:hypothetical protein ABZ330_00170 [Streptomyces sp. NPDC006172]|uniref:hypothetical protein n=1 Tax=Streptomyces sp. NPDC006172 TaxID=3154470 RepID=UPI00340EA6D4
MSLRAFAVRLAVLTALAAAAVAATALLPAADPGVCIVAGNLAALAALLLHPIDRKDRRR